MKDDKIYKGTASLINFIFIFLNDWDFIAFHRITALSGWKRPVKIESNCTS